MHLFTSIDKLTPKNGIETIIKVPVKKAFLYASVDKNKAGINLKPTPK